MRPIEAPPVQADISGSTLSEQAASVLQLIGEGEYTAQEVNQLMQAVASNARIKELDATEYAKRMEALMRRAGLEFSAGAFDNRPPWRTYEEMLDHLMELQSQIDGDASCNSTND